MGLYLRPVVQQWGDPCHYIIDHEELVDLLQEIANRADITSNANTYGDLEVVWIEDGAKFLELLCGGRSAVTHAPQNDDSYDLNENELRTIDALADMVPAWKKSIDPEDGSLRLYVD